MLVVVSQKKITTLPPPLVLSLERSNYLGERQKSYLPRSPLPHPISLSSNASDFGLQGLMNTNISSPHANIV